MYYYLYTYFQIFIILQYGALYNCRKLIEQKFIELDTIHDWYNFLSGLIELQSSTNDQKTEVNQVKNSYTVKLIKLFTYNNITSKKRTPQ